MRFKFKHNSHNSSVGQPPVPLGKRVPLGKATGVLLLLHWKHAVTLSIVVQFLQVPFIYTDGFLLNLGLPLNLTITGIWNARDGGSPTVLGINFLALGVLLLLLWCRSAMRDAPVTNATANASPNP